MADHANFQKHVLLLEDDHDIRVLLRMALEEKDFYVTMIHLRQLIPERDSKSAGYGRRETRWHYGAGA